MRYKPLRVTSWHPGGRVALAVHAVRYKDTQRVVLVAFPRTRRRERRDMQYVQLGGLMGPEGAELVQLRRQMVDDETCMRLVNLSASLAGEPGSLVCLAIGEQPGWAEWTVPAPAAGPVNADA